MKRVFLSLGANQGDRVTTCHKALEQIGKLPDTHIVARSSFYETEPAEIVDQPLFINLVCELKTQLSAQTLLVELKQIEKNLGRKKTFRWGPRLIDLDILLYNDCVIHHENLEIPHPRMHLRNFVLVPLAELDSALSHPISNISIAQMLSQLEGESGWVRKLDENVNSA